MSPGRRGRHPSCCCVCVLDAGLSLPKKRASQPKCSLACSRDFDTTGTCSWRPIGHFVLTPRLQPFLAQHPDLSVEIEVRDRMGDLVQEGFDVAVRFGLPKPSALKARLLLRTRVVTCASPAYIARHGTPRQPRDVEKHECVLMRDPATGSPFAWEFVRRKKIVPVNATGQLMVNASGPLLAAGIGGQGITQLLELYARVPLADGRLVQVLPEWADETYPLYAYHHSSKLMSAKVRAFLDHVIAITRD